MKPRKQINNDPDVVVREFRKAFEKCRKKIDSDSFIAHIGLAHLIELILQNEDEEALDRTITQSKFIYKLFDESEGGGAH